MRLVFFTADRKASLAGRAKSPALAESLGVDALKAYRPEPGDLCYFDVSGLDEAGTRKAYSALRRRCGDSAWGVVDPEGAVADPATAFFAGASDYLGPAACRAGLDKARVKAVLAFAAARTSAGGTGGASVSPAGQRAGAAEPGACAESPAAFPGWKSIRPGSSYPFYFLYVAVSAQVNLRTRLGEAGYGTLRDRLRLQMQQALAEADALLWMETDSSALYLVPPCASNVAAASEACLRMLLGAPLVGYERLGLPFPVDFVFAMHSGETEFEAPGKTGTIVSDAVNFSFHLGAKRAEPGRLTVSGEAYALASPRGLSDLFVPAGTYEGRSIMNSRRFGVSGA
ncbi:MAG: hypothetical protein KKA67_08635 [Spirochaetes bacterium]|nr:hypothetical protein [Spirochaetota bacterium]MBU1082397.1 hypothetical protein [Spirochaetota bacterium]